MVLRLLRRPTSWFPAVILTYIPMYVCPISDPFTYIPFRTFYPVELIRNRSSASEEENVYDVDKNVYVDRPKTQKLRTAKS
jgi:hypothetical protein